MRLSESYTAPGAIVSQPLSLIEVYCIAIADRIRITFVFYSTSKFLYVQITRGIDQMPKALVQLYLQALSEDSVR
jgi:hypothetical protein